MNLDEMVKWVEKDWKRQDTEELVEKRLTADILRLQKSLDT